MYAPLLVGGSLLPCRFTPSHQRTWVLIRDSHRETLRPREAAEVRSLPLRLPDSMRQIWTLDLVWETNSKPLNFMGSFSFPPTAQVGTCICWDPFLFHGPHPLLKATRTVSAQRLRALHPPRRVVSHRAGLPRIPYLCGLSVMSRPSSSF